MVASLALPTRDLACNQACALAWKLNRQPFGSQASTQPTESHQPGLLLMFLIVWHRLLRIPGNSGCVNVPPPAIGQMLVKGLL